MEAVTVTVRSRYSNRMTAMRAKTHTGKNGRIFATLTKRQIKSAEGRVCYTGSDSLQFLPVEGFGEFTETFDGAFHAIAQ